MGEEEEFIPLSEEEMEDFKSLVWDSWAIGEVNSAEAANMILHELHVNGQFEA